MAVNVILVTDLILFVFYHKHNLERQLKQKRLQIMAYSFENDPILKMRQQLNANLYYNKVLKFIPNGEMWEFIANHDPKWKQKYTGCNGMTERLFKVLTLKTELKQLDDLVTRKL